MLKLIYSFFITLTAPFFLYSLYKKNACKPAIGNHSKEYLGFTPALVDPTKDVIWLHAVSVGEVIAATPLIKRLKKHYPDKAILVTTTTRTGAAEAAKLGSLIEHRFMPLDFSFAIERFIHTINPKVLFLMETELWPNTLHSAKKHNIPVSIINARLSQRSFKRYQKFPFIFSLLFKNITAIYCQTNEDAQRFITLGVKPQNVQVTGSIKFDISIPDEIIKNSVKLRNTLGANRPIWIAASTHQGEDEKILTAHHKLLTRLPNALLILVPRHPERFLAVAALANDLGFNTVKRTSNNEFTSADNVYLADTMGEMLLLIGASDICFMGGSLIGDQVGGHNLLEPASLAKPCLIGPSFYNFKLITDQLLENKGAIICQNTQEISNQLILLFAKPENIKLMGINALAVVNKNRGALDKTLKSLRCNF